MNIKVNKSMNIPLKNCKNAKITSKFGKRKFYNNIEKKYESGFHRGVDIIGGKFVITPFTGVVVAVKNNIKGYSKKNPSGNFITLKHNDYEYSTYCHLAYHTCNFSLNQLIKKGTVLGVVGKTGHATGKHLHFGIKAKNKWVNPIDYLLGRKNIIVTIKDKQGTFYYIVKKGDTLSSIAKKYCLSWKKIYKDNKKIIDSKAIQYGYKNKLYNFIYPGEKLIIKR